MQKIPSVFCFDGAFVQIAAVAITSLCVHADSDYKIYCLVSDVEDKNLDILRNIARQFNAEIIFFYVENQFSNWKTQAHISAAAYTRLLIPAYVPEPKAIYLDCDILVTCDLQELFGVVLDDALIAGCPDRRGRNSTKLKMNESEIYVNSGVLVLNLDRMRKEEFHLNFLHVYEENKSQFVTTDQCLINLMAAGKKRALDQRWNVMAHERPRVGMTLREWMEPFDLKGIFHFTSEVKPWHPWSGSWEAGLWKGYARLAGAQGSDLDRKPVTVAEWMAVVRKTESEQDWRGAAEALKVLAAYYADQSK